MMYLDYSEIGQNIRYFRTKRKMKQAQLAEATNVTAQHISHIEQGHSKLSLGLLLQVSETLAVDIYSLLGQNAVIQHSSALDSEFRALFMDMPADQKALCLQICRSVAEFGAHRV